MTYEPDSIAFLAEKRCPHCKRRGHPLKCGRVVTKNSYGWRCHGFRSRYAGQQRAPLLRIGEAE